MSKKIINFEAIEEASFILEEINKFRKKIDEDPKDLVLRKTYLNFLEKASEREAFKFISGEITIKIDDWDIIRERLADLFSDDKDYLF
jgi:hypothetical protein